MTRKARIKLPAACPRCASTSLKKNGSYTKKRSRVKVQRFRCLSCKNTHSQQTSSLAFRQHRPELLEEVMTLLGSGLGVRRIAQALNTTPKTIQAKIKILAVICESFHLKHFTDWKIKPRFQFDEMWSSEKARANTLTVPVVVDKESYFIVAARAAHTHSILHRPILRNINNAARSSKIKNRDYEIAKTLDRCNQMKPHGRIVMETDKKVPYQKLLQAVFEERLVHKSYNAQIPKEARKLFPINHTMACMRAENSKCRRESWYLTKDTKWFNAHLAIFIVYYNYFRKKKFTNPANKGLVMVGADGALPELKKTWKWETPAMRLGIFNKPISFKFLMENYGELAIAAPAKTVINPQLVLKKSS